ncbi:MAG: ESPR domain-containing protein, partial [Stenotrophomonas sp.]|nr:ESPR domain-containing protein [Stenotrophomonas sp.]
MNRIYRKVWNKALGQLVVASELASSDQPGNVIDKRRRGSGPILVGASLAMALGWGAVAPSAFAQSLAVGGTEECTLADGSLAQCAVTGTAVASGATAVAVGGNSAAAGLYAVAIGADTIASK